MKVLVCGGRDFHDRARLYRVLDKVHERYPITLVIQGGALGADTLAGGWAWKEAIPCLVVPAKWARHGKAAGAMRNQDMLAWEPDMVIAFPGGVGTDDMIRRAKKAGIRVRRVKQEASSNENVSSR